MTQDATGTGAGSIAGPTIVGPLKEKDLPRGERIFRIAIGTFFGAPEPETFWSDRDYVYGRWSAPHVAPLGAMSDGRMVGSNFATRWGSVGFLGPLTVRPDLQDRGIAKALMDSTMAQFDAWGTTHTGLFTFAQSPKHVSLYQKNAAFMRAF
jgi:GNAT superfamily N-acetyltransferase